MMDVFEIGKINKPNKKIQIMGIKIQVFSLYDSDLASFWKTISIAKTLPKEINPPVENKPEKDLDKEQYIKEFMELAEGSQTILRLSSLYRSETDSEKKEAILKKLEIAKKIKDLPIEEKARVYCEYIGMPELYNDLLNLNKSEAVSKNIEEYLPIWEEIKSKDETYLILNLAKTDLESFRKYSKGQISKTDAIKIAKMNILKAKGVPEDIIKILIDKYER